MTAIPPTLAFDLVLGTIASALLAGGLFMMKTRAAVLPLASAFGWLRAVGQWLRDPVWLGGLLIQAAGYALYVTALAGAPVSLLAVMMQGGIGLFVLFAVLLLKEHAAPLEWVGIGGILCAMVLLGLTLGSGSQSHVVNPRTLAAFSIASATAMLACATSRRLRHNGVAAALASGVIFGLAGLYTKAFADALAAALATDASGLLVTLKMFASPWLYLASATNIAGLILLQNSFRQARGIIAMPLSSACSNILPILGGLIAFGEALPANPLAAALRIAAFVLTAGASAMLTRGPEPLPAQLITPSARNASSSASL